MSNRDHGSEATWGLVEPFEIDNGELDGLRPQECFALGVEWQMFRSQLQSGKPFTTLVLASNADRLTKLAERSQRFVESRPASDGWANLTVGSYRV
jgi:hypothetical protein